MTQALEPENAVDGAEPRGTSVERVFFSRPDLGLDGWVSASTIGPDHSIQPLLEEFDGDSLTIEYEDVPQLGSGENQQAQNNELLRESSGTTLSANAVEWTDEWPYLGVKCP